jgi:hypothetical protein
VGVGIVLGWFLCSWGKWFCSFTEVRNFWWERDVYLTQRFALVGFPDGLANQDRGTQRNHRGTQR